MDHAFLCRGKKKSVAKGKTLWHSKIEGTVITINQYHKEVLDEEN